MMDTLIKKYKTASLETFLSDMITEEFPGKIALVSSFGAEAAILLHAVSKIKPDLPILFLETGKLFGETLRYRDLLIQKLKLTDVRNLKPEAGNLTQKDPDGILWSKQPNQCCYIRKVLPLEKGLEGFEAWISGRKRYHSKTRETLPLIEKTDDKFKLNPLINWTKEDIDSYFKKYDLPRHPLEADGFLSIGCMPCTNRVIPGQDIRSGRWQGQDKTECGIHNISLTSSEL